MHAKQVFFRTGRRIYADVARQIVARTMDGQQDPLVSRLMNYDATTGKNLNGFPLVQFGSFSEGFYVLGIGEVGSMIVADAAPLIHRAISASLKTLVAFNQRDVQLSAEHRPYPLRYTVPRMVVQKKPSHSEKMADPVQGKAFLEGLMLRSLTRQAEVAGIALPDGVEVDFVGASGTYAAKHDQRSKLAHLGIYDAIFDINLRLGGIWTAGYMLSKGHGQFDATYQLAGVLAEQEAV